MGEDCKLGGLQKAYLININMQDARMELPKDFCLF